MFGFFKDIKNAVAAVEARVKAVEDKVESLFEKKLDVVVPPVTVAVTTSEKDASTPTTTAADGTNNAK